MRAPAVSFARQFAAAALAALLTFTLVPANAFAEGEGESELSGAEGSEGAFGSEIPTSPQPPSDPSTEADDLASATSSAEGGTLAASLMGRPTAFVNADVVLDGEPVIGSFTVDGLTFAVIDESSVELVGVSQAAAEAEAAALLLPESVDYNDAEYVVGSIGAYAFYLSGITSVELPASVIDVDDRGFRSSDVASVTVVEGNPNYSSFDGALYDAEQSSLLLIPEGKQGTVLLPKEAESAAPSVFSHCPLVTQVSVEGGSAAFASENGLLYDASLETLLRVPAGATDIIIHDGCTTIAAGAMEACASLVSITAPASVVSINPDVFTSVPTATLPSAVLAEGTPQITAMVALSSTDEGLPKVDPSAIAVHLTSEADTALWQSAGFSDAEEGDMAAQVLLQASTAYGATASAMPLYAANGTTVAARWSLDSEGTLLVSGVPGQVVSCAFNEASYKEWRSSTYRFSIKKIVLDNLDVADASWWFYNMPEVETVELKGTVFSSTTSLHHFLHACVKLTSVLNFSLTHCKNLTNASCIFMGCHALPAVPAAFRLPGSVTSATHLFFGTPITSLSNFTLPSGIVNVSYMFYSCSLLESLPEGFTIPSSVTNAVQMFNNCNRLGSLPVGFSIPASITAENRDLMFGTAPTAAGLANLQKEGRADLEGKIITVYTGSDAVTKGLDWSAMGRRLGTKKIILTWNYGGGALDGAASRITGQAYSSGQKVLIPNSPSRGGYDFNNWYTTETGGQQISSSTALPTGNATYYAHWSVITFNISYSLDGGALGIPNPGTYTVEADDIVLRNPEKAGYTSQGWQVQGALGSGAATANGVTTIKQGTYGMLSCTALWTANVYTIIFDARGGAAVASMTVTYDADATLPAPAVRNGYAFKGWDTKADGTGSRYQAGVVLAKPNLAPSGTVRLYAQWEPTISADIPLDVTAKVDLLGIEEQEEASGYIESRCGEPLTVAQVAFMPLSGAADVFGAANVANVALEVLAEGATSPDARFALSASASQAPTTPAAFRMGSYGERVPISYRFDIPEALLPLLSEVDDPKPICQVAYTVALAPS